LRDRRIGAAKLVLGGGTPPGVLTKAALGLFVMTLLSVSFPEPVRSEEAPGVYEIEPIVVTGGRTVSDPGRSNRSVETVTRERIESLPVHSPSGILEYVPGVDLRRRGPLGVQADVSIRGASFEQTLVLVDGFKVSDPQTGHHDLDLPLTLDDIERVEILKGNASSLYGPNALGGVVNFITRRPSGKSARLRGTAGEFGFLEAGASLTLPAGRTANRVSALLRQSDGYRPNTDFHIATASYSGALSMETADVRLLLGYTDKEFGANGFYTDRYPGQWEETETSLLRLSADSGGESFTISPALYWRRHRDRFLLDRADPSFFENRHTTDVYGAELHTLGSSRWGTTALGVEIGGEEITSSSLGDHGRTRGGLYGEHRIEVNDRLSAALEAFAYYYSDWGWEVWPGLNAGFRLGESARLFASAGKSFRVPTYTELYYTSPANVGNPDLVPETVWSWEVGASWAAGPFSAEAALFLRDGEDLIDWTRPDEESPWQVRNVSTVASSGFELGASYRPLLPGVDTFIRGLRAGYTFLDSDRERSGFESKYLLDHLRHQVVADVEHSFLFGTSISWIGRWEERLDGESHVLLDGRLFRRIGGFLIFLEARNILDTEYTEIAGVPMPGRWVAAGVKLDLPAGDTR
jgi:iron complex outermembrane receptor protein